MNNFYYWRPALTDFKTSCVNFKLAWPLKNFISSVIFVFWYYFGLFILHGKEKGWDNPPRTFAGCLSTSSQVSLQNISFNLAVPVCCVFCFYLKVPVCCLFTYQFQFVMFLFLFHSSSLLCFLTSKFQVVVFLPQSSRLLCSYFTVPGCCFYHAVPGLLFFYKFDWAITSVRYSSSHQCYMKRKRTLRIENLSTCGSKSNVISFFCQILWE